MPEVTPLTYPSSVSVTVLAATLPLAFEINALEAVKSVPVIVVAAPVMLSSLVASWVSA